MKLPLVAISAALAFSSAQAALIARYDLNETAGPTLNDSAGVNTSATAGGVGHVYNQPSIPSGTYGSLTLAPNTWGTTAGLSQARGEWATSTNNEFGNLQNDFTVMAWINPSSIGGYQRLISRTGITSGTNGTLEGGWGFGLSGSEIIFTGYNVVDSVSTGASVQAGQWQHIAATKSPTDGVTFYLNGNLVSNNGGAANTGNWGTSDDGWLLFNAFGGQNLVGLGDEIRVYDTALTQAEIQSAAVPEPSSAALIALAGAAVTLRRRR